MPFYVAAPLTSIDLSIISGDHIVIEERPEKEMTHIGEHRIAAKGIIILTKSKFVFINCKRFFIIIGINCWNPSFDITPASLITGIITEKGVFRPEELKETVSLLKKTE